MKLTWNPPHASELTATFAWSSPHAAIVHNGATYRNGTRTPARPFTDVAIEQNDVAAIFAQKFKEHDGNIDKAFAATAEVMGEAFIDVIENHVWDIASTGRKIHKDAPNWVTIDDSGELAGSQSLEIK